MKGRVVTIWDGIQYRQVSEKEAERLVEKDMAQVMPVGGTEMKFRKQFTGYTTREVRAETKPAPAPEPKPAPKPEAEKPKPAPEPKSAPDPEPKAVKPAKPAKPAKPVTKKS